MKYMGSKRWMLENGLGHLLDDLAPKHRRFIDLFAGTGVVSSHVAKKLPISIEAFDLQEFSVILTRAVIGRCETLEPNDIWSKWYEDANKFINKLKMPMFSRFTKQYVHQCRKWSEEQSRFPITKAYGGHYFSFEQAVWIDALRKTIPLKEPIRTVALAALIHASSQCAASPGHTAQPFQPTRTARKHLQEAWEKNISMRTMEVFQTLCQIKALKVGKASVRDASLVVNKLREDDLVFIDPPYSDVHYSRFYHVLETIARGKPGKVSGVGRYPSLSNRPQSRFSLKSQSVPAFKGLIQNIHKRKASAIVTFPDHTCSNGLSGSSIRDISKELFRVTEFVVDRKFSTLGGSTKIKGNGRAARQQSKELILVLKPK